MKKNALQILIVIIILFSTIILSNVVLATEKESNTDEINSIPSVLYKTHVEDIGWQNYVKDGETAGTSGKSRRLEGINIKILDNKDNLNIKYQVHVQDIGWQDWRANDEMAGTSGQAKRLEGIKINLENSNEYSVMYRVHIQDIGWQDWMRDGELAGTTGESKRLEAIQIKIVKKQNLGKLCIDNPHNASTYYNLENSSINVSGWKMSNSKNSYIKAFIDNSQIDNSLISYFERQDVLDAVFGFGTNIENPKPGFSFNINVSILSVGNHTVKVELYCEDTKLAEQSTTFNIDNKIYIKYQAHVQNVGWQSWKDNEDISGTIGESLRVEALKIQLVNQPNGASIKYRTHIQDIGWQEWKKDGEIAGTTGEGKRIEAIQIRLEGIEEYTIEYVAHVQNIGWQQWASNEMISGTVNQSLRIEAFRMRIVKSENTIVPQIKYSTFTTSQGNWSEYLKNGSIAGNSSSRINIEAIKIELENVASGNSIKYQVHSANIGWKDYVFNGLQAGTIGVNTAIEAIKIKLEGIEGYSVEYRVYVNGQGWEDWVRDGKMSGTVGESKQIGAMQIRLNIDAYPHNQSDYENIDTSKYPGYKELLDKLQSIHPEWSFKLLYTGITFSEAVKGEYSVHNKNLVPSNYSGEWICSVCGTRLYDSGWYGASEKAISYYMDTRNFLDETNIFQFLELNEYTNNSCSLNGIQSKVNGTYLQNYATAINNACVNTNVNPYYIISRLLQEQGRSGTKIGTGMDGGDGKTYYNPFNIGASGDGYSQIYSNALSKAKANGWDTMQKGIEGGINFCKYYYLENYQNTLYQNKFNIDYRNRYSLYTHQYMQNLMAAYSESLTLKSMYSDTDKLDSSFTFIIPVYENMSTSISKIPENNSETTPINVKITANGGLNLRNDASESSNVIKIIAKGEIVLSIQRGINSNWQKIVLEDGTIGYMSGNYLQQVDDVSNCNYIAHVKTSDGTGCNIRVGPSIKLDLITALSDGTNVKVINEGTYNNIDGFNWARIVLSDGRQAFMPSRYLERN